jgi:hypothetical protein
LAGAAKKQDDVSGFGPGKRPYGHIEKNGMRSIPDMIGLDSQGLLLVSSLNISSKGKEEE